MRIVLLIPDGIGIRNYLYSNVIKYINEANHEVVIWHSLPDEVIKIAEKMHGISIESHKFESFPDPFFIRLYREATTYARLHLNAKAKKNPTILTNWNTKRNTFGKKLLYPMAEKLGAALKSYLSIEKLEKKIYQRQRKTDAFKTYQSQLKAMKVDVLFCTHQRVPQVVSTMLAAQSIGIKTVTSIFSWDNLPKARLPFRADQYLVWSSYMKNELLDYYPDIKEKSIAITGTPQFDFYRDANVLTSREDFAKCYDLDLNKKWVLFSGNDVVSSPFEVNYLKDVAEELGSYKEIQIIFRQVPVETADRFKPVIEKYDNIKHLSPEWQNGKNWTDFYPKFRDIKLLVNLAKHCAAVINVGSTMALDFSNFNTPALYIKYDQPISPNWSVDVCYKFQHFRSMEGLDPVGWINSPTEISEKVKTAIEHPEKIGPDRKKWFNRIVEPHPTKSASERIVEALIK